MVSGATTAPVMPAQAGIHELPSSQRVKSWVNASATWYQLYLSMPTISLPQMAFRPDAAICFDSNV
jgi:hypothetical protein